MQVIQDTKAFIGRLKAQDFGFYMAAGYLTFEYLRPHVIYPMFDFLPWARITILLGLFYVLAKGYVKLQTTHVLLLGFLITAYISSFLSYNPDLSFSRMDVLLSWVVVVIFFTSSVRNLNQYKLLLVLFFIFLFKLSLFGARTWAGRGFTFTEWGISGPRGFFQNSGELSLLMVVFAAMSFGYIAGHKHLSKLYYLAPITAAMTVLASSARGSQLALAVVVVLFALRLGKIKPKNLIALLLIGWVGVALLPEEQKERFSTMGQDGTSESRLVYWEKGIEMTAEHKWFGVGMYMFAPYFAEVYAPHVEFENFRYRQEVAHNSYIQVSSEMGLVGLAFYLSLLWMCFRLANKTRKLVRGHENNEKLYWIPTYCVGVNTALAGFLVGSTFMSVAFYPYVYLFLMFNQSLFNNTKIAVLQIPEEKQINALKPKPIGVSRSLS